MLANLIGSLQTIPSLGEILALASALVWAVAIILFRVLGRRIHPLGLNLFKTVLAFVLIVPTMLLFGQPLFPGAPSRDLVLLLVSGVVGIAASDTLFFYSLNKIGASPLAIVECLYSPFVIALSYLFLGDRMTGWQLFGVVLIVSAILAVTRHKAEERISRGDLAAGIVLGVLAVLLIAVSIVIIKPVLDASPVLWASAVRLFGGGAALVLVTPFHPERRRILAPLRELSNWPALLIASLFGSFFSLILWLGGMKYAKVSVAAALNQLNAIFIVILAAVFLKERLSPWKIVAVILAFAGAYLASSPL